MATAIETRTLRAEPLELSQLRNKRFIMPYQLKTIGHATLLILENGIPILATDPWLVGSNYWRSWWLEKYPTESEIALVKSSKEIYITHSHPDHFHWPSLRRLGRRPILHPKLPGYTVPGFLENHGYSGRSLNPWQWYALSDGVRVASIPVPIDDSILVIDTPDSVVININDSSPRRGLLQAIRKRLISPGKRVVVLKSYSPASMGTALFRDDKRVPMKSKRVYTEVARNMAEILGAKYLVPFASQAFFNRSDSRWANYFKVTYENLKEFWGGSSVELCKPFITMDLQDGSHTSDYGDVARVLNHRQLRMVQKREMEEEKFNLPMTFDSDLKRYFDEITCFRIFFRKGVGFKLTSSGAEKFYNSRRRQIEGRIPDRYDFVISVPDKVLCDALGNNVMTDLGITMIIRVDTKVNRKMTYGAFLLMGLHDYGHLKGFGNMFRCAVFYFPYLFPSLLRPMWAISPGRRAAIWAGKS